MAMLLISSFSTSGSAQNAAPALIAKFTTSLNTKTAKVGDTVEAKTEKPAKLADGTIIPKSTKLLGRVAVVQSKQDGNGKSTVAIAFDKLEMKGGVSLPIKGQIVAIWPAPEYPGNLYFDMRAGAIKPEDQKPGTNAAHPAPSKSSDSEDNIKPGSTLDGISIESQMNALGATPLHGLGREVKINYEVAIEVELK
jgi:hypothetical protein